MKYLSNQFITLAAYEARPLPISGSVISVSYATGTFNLSIDGGEEFEIAQGWTLNQGAEEFRFLLLRNPLPTPIILKLYIGSRAMSYSPSQISTVVTNAPTYTKGSGSTNAAAQTFNGLDGGHTRKQIMVCNQDGANSLFVTDNAGNLMCEIPPKLAWTIETSGVVKVSNPNAVNWSVGEVFYSA